MADDESFETWSLKLVCDSNEPMYRFMRELCKEKTPAEATEWLKERCMRSYDLFQDAADKSNDPIAKEFTKFLWYAFDKIDYASIIDGFIEGLKE